MPLLDRVLVQRVKAEAKTAGGIFLPESSVKELNEAKVLAVGPGGLDKEGKRITMSVGVGDKVLIPQVRSYAKQEMCGRRLTSYSMEEVLSKLAMRSTLFSEITSRCLPLP
jgi:co-chaperonin GroES (HSP10)